jgi:hypothetical protein
MTTRSDVLESFAHNTERRTDVFSRCRLGLIWIAFSKRLKDALVFHADSLQRFCRVYDDRTRVKFAGSTGPQPHNLELTYSVDRHRVRADFRQGMAYPTVIGRRWVINHEPLLEFSRPQPVAIHAR